VLDQMIGGYRAFFDEQMRHLSEVGIDVSGYPVSHLAFRTETFEEYLDLRDGIETLSRANVENQWSGRPISKLLLKEPEPLGDSHEVDLIELIPPGHRPGYPMGLEHVGFVVGDDFDVFAERHRDVITGQQDQGPINHPLYVTFDNNRSVKFHRFSLHDVVVKEGRSFDGFHHVT
jgi:predicted metalloenzyme YecM